MILDELLKLSDEQALTTTEKSENSTRIIDLQQNRDIGAGEPIYFVFHVSTDLAVIAAGGKVEVITASNKELTTTPVMLGSQALTAPTVTKGTSFYIRVNPQVGSIGQRYLGIKYTGITAGNISCDVTLDMQDGLKFYPTRLVV